VIDIGPLRVMTFNIHHGVGTDEVLDLSRIASVIRDGKPDVVALQEADRRFGSRSDHADQPSWLGRSLGLWSLFAPSLRSGIGEYGNAVLTAVPVTSWDWMPLVVAEGLEPRSLLRCTLPSGVRIWATHFSSESAAARVDQAGELVERFRADPGPTVLLGDLNAGPRDPALSILGGQFGDVWATLRGDEPGFTFRADRPRIRIDYVLVTPDLDQRGIELVDVGSASDHHAVVADLGLPR
jgi:endonuclease/exonuclease/phosphatase family metal-dependent hydrolase